MPLQRDQRAYNVAYYAANRLREIERVRTRQAATTEFLRQLRDVPCAECGGRFAPYQMVVCANCHRLRTRKQHRSHLASRTPAVSPRIDDQRIRWRHRADILDRLRSIPCADCGGTFPQCAMDFDHRDPASKVRSVTRMINGSIDRMLAEAAKCDIVCANCHRLRTFERREKRTA